MAAEQVTCVVGVDLVDVEHGEAALEPEVVFGIRLDQPVLLVIPEPNKHKTKSFTESHSAWIQDVRRSSRVDSLDPKSAEEI